MKIDMKPKALVFLLGALFFSVAQAKWSVEDGKLKNDSTDSNSKCCFPVKEVTLQDGAGEWITGWQITSTNECGAAYIVDFSSVKQDTGNPVISVATHEVSRRCREFIGPDVFDLSTNMFTTVRKGTDGDNLPLFVTNIVISPNITCFPARWAMNTPLIKLEPKEFPYLKSIDYRSFYNCTNFQADASFLINSAVTNIGEAAFYKVPLKGSITLTNLKNLGNEAFNFSNAPRKSETWLESVKVSGSLTMIPTSCFHSSYNLKQADFSGCPKLTCIQTSAFSGCTNLVSDISLIVNPAVTNIGSQAFKNAPVSGRLILPEIQNIGTDAFYAYDIKKKAGLEEIELSPALTNLASEAFNYQTQLGSITFGSRNLYSNGTSLFRGCSSLTNVWFKGYCPLLDILNKILEGVPPGPKCIIYASTNLVADTASGDLWTSIATDATETELAALSEKDRACCFGVYVNSSNQRKAYLVHRSSPYDPQSGVRIMVR